MNKNELVLKLLERSKTSNDVYTSLATLAMQGYNCKDLLNVINSELKGYTSLPSILDNNNISKFFTNREKLLKAKIVVFNILKDAKEEGE